MLQIMLEVEELLVLDTLALLLRLEVDDPPPRLEESPKEVRPPFDAFPPPLPFEPLDDAWLPLPLPPLPLRMRSRRPLWSSAPIARKT